MLEFSSFFHAYVYVRMHTKFLQTNRKSQTICMNKICVRSFAFLFFKNSVNWINTIKIIKLSVVKHMHTGKSIIKTKC